MYGAYVGNIPFNTTQDEFLQFFKFYGATHVSLKKNPANTSLTYGFVYFAQKSARDLILTLELQLRGRKLKTNLPKSSADSHASRSHLSSSAPNLDAHKQQIFISRLPISTTPDDVKQAFLIYNPISVVVPQNPDHTIKGFAFVTFASEAQRDMILQNVQTIKINNVDCNLRPGRAPITHPKPDAPIPPRVQRTTVPPSNHPPLTPKSESEDTEEEESSSESSSESENIDIVPSVLISNLPPPPAPTFVLPPPPTPH